MKKTARNCLLAAALLLPACSTIDFSPIVGGQDLAEPGQIIWHDYLTDDLTGAKSFYGELFDWQFQSRRKYLVIVNGDKEIGGMVELIDPTERRRSSGWLPYLATERIEEEAEWVESLGAKILSGPAEMQNRGRYLTLADPSGAVIVLLEHPGGTAARDQIESGEWLWDELWTSEVETALHFYQEICGYSVEQVHRQGELPYWLLQGRGGAALAGLTEMPFSGLQSQWVPVIRVDDPVETANQALELGGRILIKPDHPLSDGTIALIRDPLGGIFMVESWDEL